ncbi:hypothetical protein KCV03_g60, partial [Aureobasidium melanogenum]
MDNGTHLLWKVHWLCNGIPRVIQDPRTRIWIREESQEACLRSTAKIDSVEIMANAQQQGTGPEGHNLISDNSSDHR